MIVYLFELPSAVWRTEIYLIQARGWAGRRGEHGNNELREEMIVKLKEH